MEYFKSADGARIIGILPNGGVMEFAKIPGLSEVAPPRTFG